MLFAAPPCALAKCPLLSWRRRVGRHLCARVTDVFAGFELVLVMVLVRVLKIDMRHDVWKARYVSTAPPDLCIVASGYNKGGRGGGMPAPSQAASEQLTGECCGLQCKFPRCKYALDTTCWPHSKYNVNQVGQVREITRVRTRTRGHGEPEPKIHGRTHPMGRAVSVD